MRKKLFKVLAAAILLLMPGFLISQAPNLGTASSFVLFTSSGNISNGTGNSTNVTGNIGTNSGTVTMGSGTVNGSVHIANATTSQVATDVAAAYSALTVAACGATLSTTVSNLTLTPNVYCTSGNTSMTGNLTLNGQGNPNAVFIIKVGGNLSLSNGVNVNLINSASQCNVYWQVNGTLTLVNNSVLRGTVIANGVIDQQQGSSVFGRALTKTGNITLKNSIAAVAFPPTASTISATGTTTFCAGGSVMLSGNSGGIWTPGGSTLTAINATASGTYYVTNTTNCGSITSNSITVTVNPLPTVAVNSGTVCNGSSVALNATGASSYTWTPGATLDFTTGATVIANPTITTTYSVTGTSILGCVKTSTSIVTVNSNPTVTVNSATICEGSSAILTAGGANTYTWSPATFLNATTGASVTSNATITANYTVTGTSVAGCTNTASSTVMVNPNPVVSVNSATICEGNSVMLTASGAINYSWSPSGSLSAGTGETVTANPIITTIYTITGANSSGCFNSTTAMVTVDSNPILSVNSATICDGSSTGLIVNGANTCTWMPSGSLNASNGTTVVANPGVTTTYTITGTNLAGCMNSTQATVSVNSKPTISVNSATICEGSSTVLVAGGADTFTWTPGASLSATNGSSVTADPVTTTIYTVTGTDANGCENSSTSEVTVNSNPVIGVNSATICTGGSAILIADNAITYTWTPGTSLNTTNGATVTADPTITTVYTVTGEDATGCIGSGSSTVMVVSNPTVSVNSATICEGGSTLLTASGAATYSWSPSTGLSATSGATVLANPAVTTVYTVTGMGGNCSDTEMSTVTVNGLPEASISADGPVSFCDGGQVILTASAGSSYLWSNAVTTESIMVTTSGDYSVTVTGANGCSATSSITSVMVNSLPTISVNSATICMGSSTVLNANGADTYTWSPSGSLDASTGASVTASPGTTTIYTVTGTSEDGCVNTSTASVAVVSNPTVSVDGGTICAGSAATLTASSANSYLWDNGATTAAITVSPITNTSYTVTGTNNGCTNTEIFSVTVNARPTVNANANPASICSGSSSTLTAGGAATYSWNTGGTNASISVSPAGTTNYMVTGTAANGCSNTASVSVFVTNCTGTTQLSPASCGSTLTALDQIVYFNSVAGATNYKLEVINDQQPFSVINIRYNAVTNFKMSWITGIQYGRTYKIRVSAFVNNIWSPWGAMCTITTPSIIPTTQFNTCGITLSALDQALGFDPVTGATNYRIEITNPAQPFNVVNVRNNTVASFKLSWVAGIQYNRSYDLKISAFVSGSWQPYGSVCTITTPSTMPTTQLDASSCGITLSSLNQLFRWNPVVGATKYKVEIINAAQPFNVVNIRFNNLTSFALSYVNGTTTGRTYDIRVAPFIGGVWGDYGDMCQVTVGSTYEGKNYFSDLNDESILSEETAVLANVFPNPNNGNFIIDLPATREVEIINMLGENVTNLVLFEGQSNISLIDQPDGVYFVKIKSSDKQQVIKIIKEN